jgi:multidrug transporter EmrE-like cation transporter
MLYFLIIINVFIMVIAQTLWKIGLANTAFSASLGSILKLLLSPYIFGGLVIYGLSTVMWLYIVSKLELSVAYPIQQGLTNLVLVLSAVFILKETITPFKVVGILMLAVGAILVSLK